MTTPSADPGPNSVPSGETPQLSEEQQRQVLSAACESVAAALAQRAERLSDPSLAGADATTVMGAFVTLKRQGHLRACCGALGRPMRLLDALREAAVRTATDDVRLPTISPTELAHLDVEVSLLHSFQPVAVRGAARVEAIEVGRHGLQIQRGPTGGLLLPSVGQEHSYTAEEFLRQVCIKAGLSVTDWQADDVSLQTFEAVAIAGPFATASLADVVPARPLLTPEELRQLAVHSATNLAALAQGATPSYYLAGCSDGTVNAVALSLRTSETADAVHFFRLSLRPGMPLQTTLFSVTETAAHALRAGRIQLPDGQVQLGLTLLRDPAMHGTVAEPDLRGIEPASRAVLVLEGAKSAWIYDPDRSAADLLQEAVNAAGVFNTQASSVFSLAVETTLPRVLISGTPRAWPGPDVRPAAVAGTFYPSEPDALRRLIDGLLADGPQQREPWPAILVPHAGLMYSGKVAAQVFQRVAIPDTVIILCPKHTRYGVEWAVAPHAQWSLPGGTLAGAPDLARRLAESISGLELDAAAHQHEHAIEVELPFLARLAPHTRVIGITVGSSADWEHCQRFAQGLAEFLRAQESRPLLVISSDMNHYASDAENRRLDETALAALERLDPEQALRTVQRQGISMCGVRPAVIVLETLKQLGGLTRCQRVAYSTSADATEDRNRVVGYAGMLFA